jgi:hypothetical protein
MSDDASTAHEYFGKAAATYELLLTKAAADTSPTAKAQVLSLDLRLANCRRRQGEYERALETVRTVIAQRPKMLDFQVVAAGILQDWGASQAADAERRSLEAIRGTHDSAPGPVWGWAEVAARVQRVLASGKADNELREKYFEARYNIPVCRRQCALAEKDPAMRTKILEVALGEIRAFAMVSIDVTEDAWKRLDGLYQQIEHDLGRQATPLARPDLRTVAATAAAATNNASQPQAAQPAQSASTPSPVPQPTTAKPPSPVVESRTSPMWLGLGFVVIAATSAGIAAWNIRRQKSARKSLPSFAAADEVNLPSAPVRSVRAAGATRTVRGNAPTTAGGNVEKPVRATAPSQPRPRPKPKD